MYKIPIIKKIKLKLISGNGGSGLVSFYRTKFIKKGGPDGGNGGKGGNIYFKTDKKINSLEHLQNKKIIKAQNGENGKKNNKTGKNGKSIFINIPINTKITIIKKNKKKNYIFKKYKQLIIINKGGKAGIGNNYLKNSTNITPLQCIKGQPGNIINIVIQKIYKNNIILIGLPNSGKSSIFKKLTLIKNIKITNYPYSTLYTNIKNIIINKKKTKFHIIDTPSILYKMNKKKLLIKNIYFIKNCKLILYVIEYNIKITYLIKNIKIIYKILKIYNTQL